MDSFHVVQYGSSASKERKSSITVISVTRQIWRLDDVRLCHTVQYGASLCFCSYHHDGGPLQL
jgi:hypothetical protein